MTPPKALFRHILVVILVNAAALAVYWNVGKFEFINFDDNLYVWDNPFVQKGFTIEGLKWAFSISKTTETWSYWHPLATISHMLDCQLFGLDAGKHHFINLFIHLINAILLYLVFYRMTGAFWRSVFVAILFAVHPLNVDSVAWIAERKNLLSTTFWMFTMLAYVYYSRRPSAARYFLVFTALSAGLMAKPMLVTLPFALLLMDFWPLRRLNLPFPSNDLKEIQSTFQSTSLVRLTFEKLPLLIISLISIMVSMGSLATQNAIIPHDAAPLTLRLQNALVSYVKYIGKILWPRDMAIYYPFPEAIPAWQMISAFILILTLTMVIFLLIKNAPYLAMGWFWFLGTLVPVIGIIQGGLWPEMADRWTYVPAIGIFIMMSWGGVAIIRRFRVPSAIGMIPAVLVLAFLMFIARGQAAVWQNSITLFSHALTAARENELAHYKPGQSPCRQGRL